MKRKIFLLLAICVPLIVTYGQGTSFNDTVSVYFREISANTNHYKDLWNLDLYGPVLLVDPVSRKIFANYPDTAGILDPKGKIFTGLLPKSINIANTAIRWNGRSWAMIMLPLPQDRQERLDLLSHELFHRSQPALGFHMTNTSNNHLDSRDGRIYLRLELEALRQALTALTNSERLDHLANAIYFRKTRYSLFPNAVTSENTMELNEGLAAYTGLSMSGRSDVETISYFEKNLIESQKWPTFVRSFAYLTTPIYGFILNSKDKTWNRQISDTTNLTSYFIRAFGVTVPVTLCPDCLNKYGSDKIINEETRKEEDRIKQIAEFKKIFIDQPHFEIRLEKMNISFDPRNIVPLEGYGTVYPTMRISDNWGILTVTGGALLGSGWDRVTLSEPVMVTADRVSGSGWILELNEGYTVKKDNSDRNYTLKKK
jgi:hypothetical protein